MNDDEIVDLLDTVADGILIEPYIGNNNERGAAAHAALSVLRSHLIDLRADNQHLALANEGVNHYRGCVDRNCCRCERDDANSRAQAAEASLAAVTKERDDAVIFIGVLQKYLVIAGVPVSDQPVWPREAAVAQLGVLIEQLKSGGHP